MTAFDTCAISARAAEATSYSPSAAKSPTVFLSIAEVDFAPEGDFILEAVGATPSVEIIPGHRDHRSGDRDKTDHDHTGIADHHRSEPLITIPRNRDHDRSESVITIVRNPQEGAIESKWGKAHLWRHGVYEVPWRYGNTVRFFRHVSEEDSARAFLEYAGTQGVVTS